MLISLHVKNFALIEEEEVVFGEGLNILSGETGAGKSILIDSVNLALGAKADKDVIRTGADYALIELTFQSENQKISQCLERLELPEQEDGTLLFTRRIQSNRNILKVNGETVTAKQVRELAEVLLDIHGQHEHQSLLRKTKHLEVLDEYAGEELEKLKREIKEYRKNYLQCLDELENSDTDSVSRNREIEFAEFECREIEEAKLQIGEDNSCEAEYRKMANGKKIAEAISEVYRLSGYEADSSIGTQLGRALRELRIVADYDDELLEFQKEVMDIDNMVNDLNHGLAEYIDKTQYDENDFREVEERLNLINHLKDKYGKTIEDILDYQKDREAYISKMADFDTYLEKLQAKKDEERKKLIKVCEKASEIRKKVAKELTEKMTRALLDLNFEQVKFEIQVNSDETNISSVGFDEAAFMISTNPGEPIKPLELVASGGELSRIMLALKTVLADKDEVETLIFDEIDTGISGKTAWKVSEKLGILGRRHQIICITHLPQIAAMADNHFFIEKRTDGKSSTTDICKLDREDSIKELARLLGSDSISEAGIANAREMKKQADGVKAS